MLKISKLADYSVLLICHLSALPERVVSANTAAQETRIPLPTVTKLFKLLLDAKLLSAVRGAQGGYRLAKSAAHITLADVLLAVEEIAITGCVASTCDCALIDRCTLQGNWRVLNDQVQGLLSGISIQEMRAPLSVTEGALHG